MDACYIARRNAISASALNRLKDCVKKFHELRDVFITLGVRATISLPRQHALFHYWLLIQLFGSPNGLCSSITESKHIKAVKKPWRRSSRYKALIQMLRTLARLSKMAALGQIFSAQGMMAGTTSSYTANIVHEDEEVLSDEDNENFDQQEENDDGGPVEGVPSSDGSLSDVKLAARIGVW